MDYNVDRESFKTYQDNQVAIIKIKSDVFDLVTDLEESELILDYIKKTEYDPEIKALLVINEPGSFREEEYDKFIKEIIEHDHQPDQNVNPNFIQKNTRFREINIINKIIKGIIDYHKLSFAAINGDVVTPFFGSSLAADFRYITQGSEIIMAHKKFGLYPSGALPYFLAHYLGHSSALEFQLAEKVSAEKALEMGLVSKILEHDGFENSCLEQIHSLLECRTCTIRRTKQLTSFSFRDLTDYFQFEASLLNL